ncbi:MAG: HK97 family phage prohead protease, partial [Chloroflexi bacterium]|nr:HK97 family phage prohead protease [Chloroflexota bacterium]
MGDPDFQERVLRGAFAKSLARGDDIRALIDHDAGRIIGRRSANTLTIEEDAHGLRVEIIPPQTEEGRSILESIKRGDLTGMSI